jgi:hypothetical protein
MAEMWCGVNEILKCEISAHFMPCTKNVKLKLNCRFWIAATFLETVNSVEYGRAASRQTTAGLDRGFPRQ